MTHRGRRILIITEGSRGDIQPFVALALGLKQAGHVVKIATNKNHGPFVSNFGLDVEVNIIDVEQLIHDDPVVRASMAKGQFPKFAAAIGKVINEKGPTSLHEQMETIKSFKPELMLASALDIVHVKGIGYRLNIPVMWACLQQFMPTVHASAPLFRDFDADWLPRRTRLVGWLLGWKLLSANDQAKVPIFEKELKGAADFFNSFLKISYSYFNQEIKPILASSAVLEQVYDDIPEAARATPTGPWIIKADQQAAQVAKGSTDFGSKEECLALEKFLAAGEAPIYMGWGSMLSKSEEFMVKFAVQVMKQVGKRGVILGGLAHLNREMLDGELKAYAAKNVLFMDTASHESLLSRCCVLVHHGGKGTCLAAVRSGTPQVVTPVFVDQFCNAAQVQSLGIGFAMPQFQKCGVDAVSKAVQACLTQPEIRRKAKEVAAKVNAEDGVARAVEAIHAAFEDIDSGKWRERQDKNKAILLSKRAARNPSCFAWLYRACCMPDYNNYHGWVA